MGIPATKLTKIHCSHGQFPIVRYFLRPPNFLRPQMNHKQHISARKKVPILFDWAVICRRIRRLFYFIFSPTSLHLPKSPPPCHEILNVVYKGCLRTWWIVFMRFCWGMSYSTYLNILGRIFSIEWVMHIWDRHYYGFQVTVNDGF